MAKEAKRANRGLKRLRVAIDSLDSKLVALLDERVKFAAETLHHKRKLGLELYQPSREAEVIKKAISRRKLFHEASLKSIYREIIGATLQLENPFTAAILGPEATYTHLATVKHFGHTVNISFESSIPDVFLKVEKKEADLGVVPIENSSEGSIVHTLDNLVTSTLSIAAEILMPVRHNLMALQENSKKFLPNLIVSHAQGLAQCRNFIESHYPGVPLKQVPSTAIAALEASKKKGVAAIASELAAEKYGLKIIHSNIEDIADNTTRFLVLRNSDETIPAKRKGCEYKTSIAFSMKDKPGALFSMLEPFKRSGINLTKIESRPSRIKTWIYTFFLDMEGHADDLKVKRALTELQEECHFYRLLGSYPKGITL